MALRRNSRESLVAGVWRDVRDAWRTLRRAPAFAAAAVLTLGLGIGANTAMFSVVNSLLLRTLPVAEPQRLALLSSSGAIEGGYPGSWGYPIWEQIRQRAGAFDGVAAWSGVGAPPQFDLAQGGETQPASGLFVSGEFFSTLGVEPLLGRVFTSADDRRGGGADGPVVVISYGLWQRRFGGAVGVIGRSLLVERVPFTIVGVTPPAFFGVEVGRSFDIALPLGTEPLIHGRESWIDGSGPSFLAVAVRLKPGQSMDAATAMLRGAQPQIFDEAMAGVAGDQSARFRQEFLRDVFTLVPAAMGTSELRQQYTRPLLAILVVVALVLLIACANIGNLLLARAAARRHEISLRLALGASRARLARQLLVESLMLASAGAGVGLLVAAWGSAALVAQLSTFGTSVTLESSIDWRVLTFTAAVTVMTAVLFGMAPAFSAMRVAPMEAMKEQSAAIAGGGAVGAGAGRWFGRVRGTSVLVVAQVALSLMLVIAAGLFVRTFERLGRVPLGFDEDRVLVAEVNASRSSIEPSQRTALYQRLVDAVGTVPGVSRAAGSITTPSDFGATRMAPVEVPGAPQLSPRERTVMLNVVTPGFFGSYGRPLRAGRDFASYDTLQGAGVAVVNETFVRTFMPDGQQVLGRTIRLPGPPGRPQPPGGAASRTRTIVGVVGDAVYLSRRDGAMPTMYLPLGQWEFGAGPPQISVSVRAAAGSPVALARGVAAALSTVDRDLAFSLHPLAAQVDATLAQERLVAQLSACFGGLALLLAAVGLYGVTSYGAARRRTEIGIRIALGAQRSDVLALVLRQGVACLAVGTALGLAGAAASTRYLDAMLFGLTPLDPLTFVAVPLVLGSIGTLAACVPALRATRVDPRIALRRE